MTNQLLSRLLVPLPLCCGAFAQQPRMPAEVPGFGGAPSGTSYGVSLDEDYEVVAQTSLNAPGVAYRFRELDEGWSASDAGTLMFDASSVGLEPTVIIEDECVFLCWVERVGSPTGPRDTLYFSTNDDEATPSAWAAPLPMQPSAPTGTPARTIERYEVASRLAAAPGVGMALAIDVAILWSDTASGTRRDELVLYRSNDAGVSFAPALSVTTAPGFSREIRDFALAQNTARTHLVWTETAAGGQVEVRHRALAHATSTFSPEVLVTPQPISVADSELSIAAVADEVAIAWLQRAVAIADRLVLTASIDAGASFVPPLPVGAYRPSIDDVDGPRLAIDANVGAVVLAWVDDRSGFDQVYGARLPLRAGAGAPLEQSVFGTASRAVELIQGGVGASEVVLVAESITSGDQLGVFTEDAGRVWTAPFTLFDAAPGESARVATTLHDARYADYRLDWNVAGPSGGRQVVGGLRQLGVRVTGEVPLIGGQDASLEVFGLGRVAGQPFLTVFAESEGSFVLPVVELDVGLAADSLFFATFGVPGLSGLTGPDGAGRTASFRVPASMLGESLWFAAIGYSVQGKFLVSDPMRTFVR